jgi:hypothetical protein
MTRDEFRSQIRATWSVAQRLCLDRSLTSLEPLRVDEEHRNVLLDRNSTYADIYRSGLSRSHYNIILDDYAYFQFSFSSPTDWRLAYFPNPWISGVTDARAQMRELEQLERDGEITHEEIGNLIEALPLHQAIPPIRYEYSRDQYRELEHPAAHFHIGRDGNNRWPCNILLGPQAFSMNIFRLYYFEDWRPYSSRFGAADPCVDQQFQSIIDNTQISHEFSQDERRTLHFGRSISFPLAPIAHHDRMGPRRRRLNLG